MSDQVAYLVLDFSGDVTHVFLGPPGLLLTQDDFCASLGCPDSIDGDHTPRWAVLREHGIETGYQLDAAWLEWVKGHPGVEPVEWVEIE